MVGRTTLAIPVLFITTPIGVSQEPRALGREDQEFIVAPTGSVEEPVEEQAEPVEELAEPVEEQAEPVEEQAEPVEELAEPVEEQAVVVNHSD